MNLEQRLEQLAQSLSDRVRDAIAADLRALVDEFASEAAADRDRAAAEAREAAASEMREQVVAEVREQATADGRAQALAEARDEARAEAREQALAEAREHALAVAREESQGQVETAVAEVRREHEALVANLRATHDAALEAARQTHQAELDSMRAAHDAALREQLAAVDAERAALSAERDDAIAARDAAAAARDETAAEGVPAGADVAPAAPAADQAAIDDAHAEERQADLACSERLLDYFRAVDGASTLSHVLDALADYAGAEAGRAALFVVHGDGLRLWRATGDRVPSELADGLQIGLDEAGVLADVVRTGPAAGRTAAPDDGAWGSALAPLRPPAGRVGFALPVVVGGAVVAVLHADEGGPDRSTPSAWPELVEVAARHAGRCLDTITAARAAALRRPRVAVARSPAAPALAQPARMDPAEVDEDAARRHARLLVSEIRLYNEPAVIEGRRARDIRARLAREIDRAQRLYEARIPDSVVARTRVFEEELVSILSGGDASLMGPSA